jgi:hypothetical protein
MMIDWLSGKACRYDNYDVIVKVWMMMCIGAHPALVIHIA